MLTHFLFQIRNYLIFPSKRHYLNSFFQAFFRRIDKVIYMYKLEKDEGAVIYDILIVYMWLSD